LPKILILLADDPQTVNMGNLSALTLIQKQTHLLFYPYLSFSRDNQSIGREQT